MGKTLADQITELANKSKVPDFDIEDEQVFEHDSNASGSEASDEDEALQAAHYVQVGRSKLRNKHNVLVEDSKYSGSKGSREALFNSSGEEDGSESDRRGSDSDGGSDSDSDAPEATLSSEQSADESARSDSDSGDSDSDSGSDAGEENSAVAEDADAKRERLSQLVRLETQQAMGKLNAAVQNDALKGYAIMEQSRFFEGAIDVRIKLQKAIAAANQLPLTKQSWESRLDAQDAELLESTCKLLHKVAGKCAELRTTFQNKERINQTEIDYQPSKKRSIDALAEQCHDLDSQLRDYRGAVLHMWSSKVAATSGKTALSSSKFKAINQPANVQVDNQLADMPRLVKRTQLNRRGVVPLGFEEDYKQKRLPLLDSNSAQDGGQEEDADVPANYDPRKKDNNAIDASENPYIFDDEDFYRVLLNDLVDKKILNAQQGSNVQVAIKARSQNKLKKNVDTKASKGRKLNYSVQEPIANYEAPINGGFKWSDEQIDEFFAGLLGQRVNFDERETSEAKDNEEEAIEHDDLRIFG
ncbi:AAL064Wp [Eremothecium gossypii ATCC 10895]|uniref:Protein BFR2 n=1 Tax=Eremothecium gossypii (strain ATCC 10895 / CBS 109.51 / FGSC 9923 / NRRL Y-1056) TaxID=284811 RepID=BFR2_EREGS|nr:AAL064Wp [Eremothecium gossypii ATCC 10895]Q75EZ2.1 RecName: Full=Protein BFR2 [Eremothecium gossypii ATCC 10895]AAS50302.1 AAL064Wp [Eremothecium gossypii ATCC 10895]AEY94588.1 FAAL064Wp [Eremothecium gossypii FDAG1]